MAPKNIRDTYKTMSREELEEIRTLFETRRVNVRLRYPDMLWTGTDFSVARYPRRWMPTPTIPPLLNEAEAREYTAAYTRAHQQQRSPQCTLAQDHMQGKIECKDLLNLSSFRAHNKQQAPLTTDPGFATPKRRNQDLKNEYEVRRLAHKRELELILQLLATKSDPPTNLPPKRPDEDDDDDDEAGKGQGTANTSMPLLPQATAA